MGIMAGVTPEQIRAWVEASCAQQGVPVAVTDPATVERIVVLLGGTGREGPGRGAATRRGLQPPDRGDAVGAERFGGSPGADGGVVEDGGDDGALAVEVEPGPFVAEPVAVADDPVEM